MQSYFDTANGPTKAFEVYCGSSITDKWPHGTDITRNYYGGAAGPWGVFEKSDEDWRDVTTTVTFYNYRVYATADGVWRTKYDSVEVAVNGSVIGTGGSFDKQNNTFIAPNSVPVYSGCLYCTHQADAGYYGATGYILDITAHVSAQGEGTYGVRWMVDGAWVTTPILMPPRARYASGGDSYGFTLRSNTFFQEVREYIGPSEDCKTGDGTPYDAYMLTTTAETGGARDGWLFCNPPREAIRMNPNDYEALVLRYGSFGWEDRLQTDPNPADGGRTYLTDNYGVVHPARSGYLARVTNANHVFEDLLHEPTYCWVNESWSSRGPDGYLAIAAPGVTVLATDRALYPPCGNNEHDRRSFAGPYPSPSWIYNFPARSTAAPLAGNLYGGAPWGTYFNTIGSPHYSYFLYFPQADEWKIGGTGVSSDELWYPARQQLIDHSGLPAGERSRHISDVIAEPITQNGITGLTQSVSNMPCYWGINRFTPQKIEMPDSVTLAASSAPRWTFEDGSTVAVVGSGVTIPASQTKVSFALGSYTAPPYQLPHLAKEIASYLTDPSVADCKVYLVAGDGQPERTIGGTTYPAVAPTRVLIGSGSSGGRWLMPKGDSKEWLTTAAYDGGADWGTDTYTRLAPAKDDGSAAMIGNGTSNVTLGSTAATRTGVRIDWEFTRKDGAQDAALTLPFPTFFLHDEAAQKIVKEASRHAAILHPNGPVTRYGGGGFFDYGADSLVPYEIPETALNLAPMAGDWLAFKRPWYMGKADDDGLLDEIKTIFEEGVEYTTYKHLWRDPFDMSLVTHSFVTPGTGGRPIACLVNSYSAIPPTGAMPTRKRSIESDWLPTGAVGTYTYSSVSNRKNIVSPQPLKVYRQGDTGYNDLLTPLDLPEGWYGGYFVPPTVQDDPVYVVRDKGDNPKDWFRVRGWRGFLTIIGLSKASKGSISSDVSNHNRHVVSYPNKDGKLTILIASNSDPTTYDNKPTDVEADSVCVRWLKDKTEALSVAYAKDSTIYFSTSLDEGATFKMPTTIAQGDNPTFIVSKNSLRYFYWLVKSGDTADIHGQIRTNQDDIAVEEFTVKEGVDSSPITVREAFQDGGKHLLIIDYIEDGDNKAITSKNGIDHWT